MPVDLSVVIPAYNEAHRLASTLEQVVSYLRGRQLRYEVIVVNDGSTDRTAEVAADFSSCGVWVLSLSGNRGKGAALRHGVVASSGRRILLTDADLSTPITELGRLEPLLAEAEIVMGSRAVEDARIGEHQPRYREWLGSCFNLFLRAVGAVRFRDTQCGFKLLDGTIARGLFPALRIDGFAYDVELVMMAERRGCRVVEVGVEWNHSPVSRVRPLRDGLRMVVDVLRVRFGARGGR